MLPALLMMGCSLKVLQEIESLRLTARDCCVPKKQVAA